MATTRTKKAKKAPKKQSGPGAAARRRATRSAEPVPIADKITPLGRDAATAAERRGTLEWALKNPWAADDISRIERIDTAAWHGWEMTPA